MSEKVFPLETKHFFIQPENMEKLWTDEWGITLKEDRERRIGTLQFVGEFINNEAKIEIKLDPEYDKSGYYSEIFFLVAKSIFRFTDVREVHTECRYDNEHLLKGIEKAGFVYREAKDGNRYYSMKKQKTVWTGVYIFLGLIAGFLIGLVVSNLWLGTISGIVIGIIIGVLMDKREEKGQA